MGTKTVGEMAFILFSCCFLFSCLGCGTGGLFGSGGLGQRQNIQ